MIFSPCFEYVCMLQKVSKVQSSYYIHLFRVYIRFRLDLELHDMITKRVGKLYIIYFLSLKMRICTVVRNQEAHICLNEHSVTCNHLTG